MDQGSDDFIDKDWDDKYALSTLHLSFFIQTLFPIHVIKWESTKRHYENVDAKLKPFEDDIANFIVTGSIAEGYSIPPSICRSASGKTPEVEILSDVDTLWVSAQMKVYTEEEFDSTLNDYKGYFEYKKNSPGYVRICLPSTKEKDETFIYDHNSGKCYLSGIKLTDKMFDLLKDKEAVTKQGPAISMIDQLSTGSKFHVSEGISKDLVLALPCFPWPKVANDWAKRVEGSKWLSLDVVGGIIQDGCHAVAVPSKNTAYPEFEWRISFSASEGKLAREAVTDYQRQCFIYVKILHHQKTKPAGILSSYMFKSVFLHCCENLPISLWREYPGSCVLYILDVMLDCLRKRYIPTYFLPDNNLIRHLTNDDIEQAIADVEDIRRDPISPVLAFTDERLFSHQSVYFTFREMVEPLLSDMQTFKEHKNREIAVLQGMLATGYRICHYLIGEESSSKEAALFKHQEAVRCLINIYNLWLNPMNLDATLSKFIYEAGLAIKDPHLCLVYMEALVSLEGEYPELASLNKDIAIMFHKSACLPDIPAERRKWYKSQAETLLKRIHEEENENVLDYALFLLEEKRFSEAQGILESYINTSSSNADKIPEAATFTEVDAYRLDDLLRTHVETHGNLAGDKVAFAYYFLISAIAYEKRGSYTSNATTVVGQFEGYCKDRADEGSKHLLNLARNLLAKEEESDTYFNSLVRNCILL